MSATNLAVEQLQRVLLPRRGEPADVRSLYLVEAETNKARLEWSDRFSVTLPAGAEASFQTYFNAFPASYWRRWTQLTSVVLRLELEGEARVDLYRSKIDGARIGIEGDVVANEVAEFEVSLAPFEDGGWIWFDLTAETDVRIVSAGWYAPAQPAAQQLPDGTTVGPFERKVVVGIPTFNRPDDAVAALRELASDPLVDEVIEAVLMPDQGTRQVADHPDFAAATAPFGGPEGGRFRRFKQGNLGGSGGYSRIMYEALADTTAPYILYMDDDIAIEPDSILRALAFGRYAKTPTLVGGQMLNLQERSHLHTMGEHIGRHDFMWTASGGVEYDHDFSKYPLSDRKKSKDLHRRIDVEFNGWWTCLIPRVVAERIGQPLPLFIKWDDAEYGLRAARAGFPTATVPGVAIWHMAWSDKDDAIDWQAYFHLRNRLVVAALYHEGPTRGIWQSSVKALVKHLVCLEYSTAAIQIEAIRDFLRGPEALFELLPTALPKIAAMRKDFPDAVVIPSASELPGASGIPASFTKIPLNPLTKVRSLAAGVAHNLRREDPAHHEVPQANFPPINARWFSLSRVDGVTVTTADGRGVVYRKRDRAKAKALLSESLATHRELADRFEEMKGRYRAAHAELTGREAWARVFDAQ